MNRAADHLPTLARSLSPRVVYTDLDGTLFGPGGSLFASSSGDVTASAAEALAALHRAGIEVVPVSGRTEAQVREVARIIGASSFLAELGGLIVHRGERIPTYPAPPGPGTPYQVMARSGAAGMLLDAFRGRLEPHTPWAHQDRECTMLFRGHVDDREAVRLLHGAGYRWLDLQDNGVIRRRFPGLDLTEVHAYHLTPAGVAKAPAVATDLELRGLSSSEAVAVGDAVSDVALAASVGAVFVVANGAGAIGEGAPENVYVTDASHGDGFAEAVLGLLEG